jgi:hypothetical protein
LLTNRSTIPGADPNYIMSLILSQYAVRISYSFLADLSNQTAEMSSRVT